MPAGRRPVATRRLGTLLLLLAAGLVATSILGPAIGDAIRYPVATTLLNQTIGLDVVSLVVAPVCVAVGILALRGHPAAPLLVLGPGLYAAYMFTQYIVGPDHLDRARNSERYFPLYAAMLTLGFAVVLVAWNIPTGDRYRLTRRRARLIGGVLLPLAMLLTFSRYLPALGDAMSDTPVDGGYLAGPTFFWTIAMLDLGIALPAGITACVGLWRDAAWASRAMAAVVGRFALVGPAVAGMGLAMYLNDDSNASAGSAVTMVVLAAVFVALAVFSLGSLLRGDGQRP